MRVWSLLLSQIMEPTYITEDRVSRSAAEHERGSIEGACLPPSPGQPPHGGSSSYYTIIVISNGQETRNDECGKSIDRSTQVLEAAPRSGETRVHVVTVHVHYIIRG